MRDVAIIGVGSSEFGELWERSLRDIFAEAALAALRDAGVDHIDSLVVGCMSSGLFNGQEHLGALLADTLGARPCPATRVESACGSGAAALRTGWIEVASGAADVVLVGGVEKMTDISGDKATFALATASDVEYESFFGATFPALNAMCAQAHMERYGTTREQLALVAVKNHANGALNPLAQFRKPVTVDAVVNSAPVADPLRMMDCAPISDGAAAAVLCPLDMARRLSKKPVVRISGVGAATDTIALHDRPDITWYQAVADATARALAAAGRKLSDVNVAELHDAFTINELLIMEAIGLVPRGQSGRAVADGMTALNGKLPVNPSGGLKAKGHPVGATGVSQIQELVLQLRGEAGARQVKGARIALAQNMGGVAASCFTHLLELE